MVTFESDDGFKTLKLGVQPGADQAVIQDVVQTVKGALGIPVKKPLDAEDNAELLKMMANLETQRFEWQK